MKEEKKSTKRFVINGANENKIDVIDLMVTQMLMEPIPGFYEVQSIGLGTYATFKADTPSLPKGAEEAAPKILDTKVIDHLFSEKSIKIHQEMNAAAKAGYIFYGKQGTGKTTTMFSVAKYLVEKYQAVAFEVQHVGMLKYAQNTIKKWRELNPDLIAIFLMDECEESMEEYESDMKSALDSVHTPSKTIFIGTTNYIDKIPDAILNRPSRINASIDCSNLNDGEDLVYSHFTTMNNAISADDKLSDAEIKALCPNNVGKTVDELKHVFLNAVLGSPKVGKVKSASTIEEELS